MNVLVLSVDGSVRQSALRVSPASGGPREARMPNGLPWLHLVPAMHPGQLHSCRPGGYICNFYPVAASCASIKRAPQNPVFILCPRAEGRIVVNELHGMTSRERWQAPYFLFPFDSSLDCQVFSKVTGVGGGLPDTMTDVGVSGNSSGLGIPSVFLGVSTQSETLVTSNTLWRYRLLPGTDTPRPWSTDGHASTYDNG